MPRGAGQGSLGPQSLWGKGERASESELWQAAHFFGVLGVLIHFFFGDGSLFRAALRSSAAPGCFCRGGFY